MNIERGGTGGRTRALPSAVGKIAVNSYGALARTREPGGGTRSRRKIKPVSAPGALGNARHQQHGTNTRAQP